jgi:hypothetical protein
VRSWRLPNGGCHDNFRWPVGGCKTPVDNAEPRPQNARHRDFITLSPQPAHGRFAPTTFFMNHPDSGRPEPFGTVLGHAPGDVPVYSSDYDTADETEFPDRYAYRSLVDGIYMGQKWQCVEFARRWLYLTGGTIFDEVAMAYDIFRLQHLRNVFGGTRL